MDKFTLVLILSCIPFLLFAQKKKSDTYTFQSSANIQVGGNLGDWQQLTPLAEEAWSFGVVKDGGNLFVAVKVQDAMLVQEAMRHGILVNISYNSKKKDGAQLLFPFPDKERVRALAQEDDLDLSALKQALIKSSHGYQLRGFSKVVDGLLSFKNTYGIQAVAKLDSNEHFMYESVIPLDLITFKESDIAVQIVVNNRFLQLQKLSKSRPSASPYSMYGRYQTSSPTIRSPYKFKTDVWVFGKVK